MTKHIEASFVALLLAVSAVSRAEDTPQFPEFAKPAKQHEWLQQLVGQWDNEIEAAMPDQPPMTFKGTETIRPLGGFWIVGENKNEFMGQSFTGLLTLGYDADKKQFVGTWVDSMTGHLWTYHGSLDSSGKMLTLLTEGPCPLEPGKQFQFRETLELKDKDHKIFTSQMQGTDGRWSTMMTIHSTRKKGG